MPGIGPAIAWRPYEFKLTNLVPVGLGRQVDPRSCLTGAVARLVRRLEQSQAEMRPEAERERSPDLSFEHDLGPGSDRQRVGATLGRSALQGRATLSGGF